MEVWKVDGIEVDICHSCEGAWFDHGELEKLLQRSKAARKRGSKSSDANLLDRASNAADGLSLLGDMLGSALDKTPEIAAHLAGGIVEVLGAVLSGLDF